MLINRPDKGLSQIDGGVSKPDWGFAITVLGSDSGGSRFGKDPLLSNTSRNVVGLDGYGLEIVAQEQI